MYNRMDIAGIAFCNLILAIHTGCDYGIWCACHDDAVVSGKRSGGNQPFWIIMVTGNDNGHTIAIS